MLDDDFAWFLYYLVTKWNIPGSWSDMFNQCLLVYFGKGTNNIIMRITWGRIISLCLFISTICWTSFSWFHWYELDLFYVTIRRSLVACSVHLFGFSLWNWEAKYWFLRRVLCFCIYKHETQIYLMENVLLNGIHILLIIFNGWLCLYATV